jgi:peptidoglycan/xylan/chitin deacetylase (PgdA/CDA1 family)
MGAFDRLDRLLGRWRKGHTLEAKKPSMLWLEHYESAARKLGFDRPYLFLSFDCDTDLDAEVAEEVYRFLEDLGIKATFAVPGAQLLKSPKPYQRLAKKGAEFINHSGLPHAKWNGDQWVGITFYDSMSPEEVEVDIRRGHEIVTEVIGSAPIGFRAPHFGCYQKPEQINLLHRTAANLGYRYCSTTIPSFGLKYGPAYETHGLLEIPCFGSIRNPETILDSWTYLTNYKRYSLGNEYFDLMIETVDFVAKNRFPALLTWYADPAHVIGQRPFEEAMKHIASSGITSYSGGDLVDALCQSI